jgi:glycerol-3-phosphate dehydrogenase
VTRDYTLVLDVVSAVAAASVFGGKIITYRRPPSRCWTTAPSFPHMTGSWTGTKPLPGGDRPARFRSLRPRAGPAVSGAPRRLFAGAGPPPRHIRPTDPGQRRAPADLGTHFGDTLYAAEIDYLVASEWALTAEDILWRRTKCGLHLNQSERDAVAAYLATRH